ncbi:MAG: hypothetical protein AABX83_02085 [Nanoarchaeota archaeon]
MGFIKRTLVVFISIITVFLLCLFTLFLIIRTFLYPSVYVHSLEQSGAYRFLDESLANTPGATFIKTPQEGVKLLVDGLVGNILSYLRSDTDSLNLTVQLDDNKLKGFFLESIKNLTVCSEGRDPFEGEPCRPLDRTPEEFLDDVIKEKNLTFFDSTEVDLAGVYGLEKGSDGEKNLEKLRWAISLFQKIFWVFTFAILIFFFLLFLVERNIAKFVRMEGINIFAAGFIFIFSAKVFFSIDEFITQKVPGNSPQIVFSLVNTFLSNFASKVNLYGTIEIVIGMILFAVSFFIGYWINKKKNFKDKN